MALPVPELPPPGEVIEGPWGAGTPNQLIPHEGVPTIYGDPTGQVGPTWSQVWDKVKELAGAATDAIAVGPSPGDIGLAIEAWASRSFAALSGFINLSIDYTATLAHYVGVVDGMILGQIESGISILFNDILDVQNMVNALLNNLERELRNDIRRVEHEIETTAEGVIHIGQVWAIDNIYNPLEEQLGQVREQLSHVIDAKVLLGVGAAEAFTLAQIAPIFREMQTLQTRVQTLEQESEECTQPICEVVGPKTDWGKWLRRFGPLAIWAMLAAVAAEDPSRIEDLGETLGRTLGPVLESWVTQFALGGGGFDAQPAPVSGAIGRNPIGL